MVFGQTIRLATCHLIFFIVWWMIDPIDALVAQESTSSKTFQADNLLSEKKPAANPTAARDIVWKLQLKAAGEPVTRIGNIWVEAVDGSILFHDRLGHLHMLTKADVLKREMMPEMERLKAKELERRLRKELPAGFSIHQTKNYTVCYWTDKKYAQWVGGLYERLNRAFNNYWKNRGFKIKKPARPQIVIVFGNRAQYDRFATLELKASPAGVIGYYHMLHNWVVMYDLTANGQFRRGPRSLSRALSDPRAIPMVATIVHEATHQLMFNNGMETRLSPVPMWVSEGLAVYFESPDLKNSRGWSGIGKVNVLRLGPVRRYFQRRPADSLKSLIQDDKRFRDTKTGSTAYAEAWAFNYFLLKRYTKAYSRYLKDLSNKRPLVTESPEERIALFEKHIGKPLPQLDKEFRSFVSKLR